MSYFGSVVDPDSEDCRVPSLSAGEWDFSRSKDYQLLGRASRARNVDRSLFGGEETFKCIEKGMFNLIDKLTHPIADEGDTMLMFSGRGKSNPKSFFRQCFILSGVTYSPTVFDITRQEFERKECQIEDELQFPFTVEIMTRACRCLFSVKIVAHILGQSEM